MYEWPLLIFTLLLQGAVGLTLFISMNLWSGQTQGSSTGLTAERMPLSVFIICLMTGLGLLASVFHLGYPLKAFNSLRHISSSWLSREIVFASLFLATAGLCFLTVFFKQVWWKGLLPVALLMGLIDVYCMSEIYMNTSVVTWTHANTLVMFFGSVGIIGAVTARLLLPLQNTVVSRCVAGVVAAAVLIRLVTQIPYMAWLAQAGLNDVLTFPHDPLVAFQELGALRLCGWALSVIGALLFVTGALRHRNTWLFSGSLVLLAAEVMLRFAFFSIH